MTLHQLAAALAAALLLAGLPAFGDTWAAEPWVRSFPKACTPEMQRCLDKLELRLGFHGRVHDWLEIENALLELHQTDSACALLLQGRGFHGF
jgi:hypothetical protein